MPKFCEISPAYLMRLIGALDAPTIIDVCIEPDFARDRDINPHATCGPRHLAFAHSKPKDGAHKTQESEMGESP